MGAQKVLELKESHSFEDSHPAYSLRLPKSDLLIKNVEVKKLKGALSFGLSVVYFLSLIYFMTKLLS